MEEEEEVERGVAVVDIDIDVDEEEEEGVKYGIFKAVHIVSLSCLTEHSGPPGG